MERHKNEIACMIANQQHVWCVPFHAFIYIKTIYRCLIRIWYREKRDTFLRFLCSISFFSLFLYLSSYMSSLFIVLQKNSISSIAPFH